MASIRFFEFEVRIEKLFEAQIGSMIFRFGFAFDT